jgi:hypothetical protein
VNFFRSGNNTAASSAAPSPTVSTSGTPLRASATAPTTPVDDHASRGTSLSADIHSPPSSRQHSPSLRTQSTPVYGPSNGATTATTHSNALAAPRPQLPSHAPSNASDMLRAVAGQRYGEILGLCHRCGGGGDGGSGSDGGGCGNGCFVACGSDDDDGEQVITSHMEHLLANHSPLALDRVKWRIYVYPWSFFSSLANNMSNYTFQLNNLFHHYHHGFLVSSWEMLRIFGQKRKADFLGSCDIRSDEEDALSGQTTPNPSGLDKRLPGISHGFHQVSCSTASLWKGFS